MIKDEIYKFFADYIYSKSGMVYEPKDYYRLDTRLKELQRIFEKETVEDIYQLYKGHITPDMNAVLINISTNNETYFFRDNRPFTLLVKNILPEICKSNPMGNINIWSCASSTGQEALSILMSIDSWAAPDIFSRVTLHASDISTDALNKAKGGIYNGLDVQRGLPINMLVKYFNQKDNENWEVDKKLLNKIKFFEFNLLKDKYPKDTYHVVFCRNVLIYQENKNKNEILNNIFSSIRPGGYLFMGNGESLIGMQTGFERISLEGLTVYQRKI